jgi:hypothetical protein
MKKVVVLVLSFGLIGSAMGQIVYPTNVFWQFLEGLQAGDSSTLNYLEYKNGFLLLETNQRDEKVLQIRNELNNTGIVNLFIDDNGNGGISADSSNGNTVVKLRGALSDHSYINNEFVSVGRGGQSQDYGGTIDGAQFTVSSTTREPDYGLWDANNYQMMLQSAKDSLGGYVGLAFTSESAAQDRNVGAFINYRKTGNNGRGELHFGTKTSTTSLADGVHAMKIYDGSVTIDSTIVLPNLATGTSDTVLILDGDVVQKKDISSFADNIYNTDGTLTGDRTLDLDTYDLTFNGGNVGIGTNAPSALLNVQNSSNGVLLARFKDNINAATYLDIKADPTLTDYTALYFGSDRKIMSKQGGPLFLSCNVNFVDGLSAKMSITPTEVQIGTITGARLAVKGNGSTSATTSFLVQNSSNTSLLTIRDNGNVGIGTTTPSAKIHTDNTATTGVGAIIENSHVTNTDDIIQFHNSTGEVASVTNEGGITASHDVTFTGGSGGSYELSWNGKTLGINNSSGIFSAGGTNFGNNLGMYKAYTQGSFNLNGTGNSPQIRRDVADGTTSLTVLNANASSTGDIVQFHNSTGEVASVTNEGYLNIKAATGTSDTVLILDGDVVQKKVLKNQTIISGIWSDFLSASTTESAPIISGNWQSAGNRGRVQYVSPASGTISDIYIKTTATQPATGSLLFELYVNDIIQLTITVPAGSAAGTFSNTVDSVSISTGDLIHYYIVNNATSNSTFVSGSSMIFTYD